MTKKIISLMLIFAMLIPFSPAVAADNTSAAPTVEKTYSSYHSSSSAENSSSVTESQSDYTHIAAEQSESPNQETVFIPESYTYDQLTSMDAELDSDSDGLKDVIELVYAFNRYNADTDGDGVNDYTEFCITCTDVLVPDGNIDTDGDGLTNAEEAAYGTNPDDLDSDNDMLNDYDEVTVHLTNPTSKDTDEDGVHDYEELELGLNPLSPKTDGVTSDSLVATSQFAVDAPPLKSEISSSSTNSSGGISTFVVDQPELEITDPSLGSGTTTYSGTLYTNNADTAYQSSVTYSFNPNWFFSTSTTYKNYLATLSSLAAAIAYDGNYLNITSGGTLSTNAANAVWDWMTFHGFTNNGQSYDLSDTYSDQHVSEMFVGHRQVYTSGQTKNVVCVIIRGTNNTLDEWQSNFDVGTTANFSSISEWTNSSNHMGFDITANRLNTKLSAYLTANSLTSSNCVLWITGHSRGGALANILAAKRIDAGYDVMAYTFAAPTTTTSSTVSATKYQCIHNVINEDDLVPQLPLVSWDFKRYGSDHSASIETTYASQWDSLVSGSENYKSSTTALGTTVTVLGNVATNRNACYVYRTDDSAYYEMSYTTADERDLQWSIQINLYPNNVDGLYYYTYSQTTLPLAYKYRFYQKPAFFMQLLAAKQAEELSAASFGIIGVAYYLADAKAQLVALALNNYINHPHYPESYYLLATKIST